MKTLFHARTVAGDTATTRKQATSRWRLVQFGAQQIAGMGEAQSELRNLAAEIDQGAGARFFFRQSENLDVLHRISTFDGMSSHLVEQLPYLNQGEAVMWVKGKGPVLFQHRLLQRELSFVGSNFSRERNRSRPVYKTDAYMERKAKFDERRRLLYKLNQAPTD